MDDYDHLRNFWTPLLAYSLLLGIQLLLLGIALAGFLSAWRKHGPRGRDQLG
jgi:hypothetical protein